MAAQRNYLPNVRQGFARCAAESEHPALWRGLVRAFAPAMGIAGPLLFDLSGHNKHAAITGGSTAWRGSPVGPAAYFFPATTGYYTAPSQTAADTLYRGSVFVLLRLDDLAVSQILVDNCHSSSNAWYLSVYTDGRIQWRQYTTDTYRLTTSSISAGEWYSVIATWNTRQSRYAIYVNGMSKGLETTRLVPYATNYGVYSLGSRADGTTTRYTRGAIALNAVWSRELTQTEVLLLHAEPLCLFNPYRFARGSFLRRPCAAYRRVLASTYGESQ